jgi:hypothetical protein
MKRFAALLLVIALALSVFIPAAEARTFPIRQGQKSADVRSIQAKLGVDKTGYFGTVTLAKVKAFQRKHKLAADGIVGIDTWHALFATKKDKSNILLLARLIHKESSRTGNLKEQIAIGNTVMNYAKLEKRSLEKELRSGRYTTTRNWTKFKKTKYTAQNLKAARMAYWGVTVFEKKPYYFISARVKIKKGSWRTKLPKLGRLGNSVFWGRR